MKLDQIQIRTQDAIVDLNISKSQQYLKQTAPKQTIEQPAATLQMKHTDAKLLIDSSQVDRDLGFLSAKEAIAQAAQKGKAAVMKGIARKVREGNQLMDISNSKDGSAIANLAKSHDTIKKQNIGIKWIPSADAVKIKYQAGSLNIHVQANKPKIDVKLGDVSGHYVQSKVTGSLIQRQNVETTVIKGE